MCVCAPVTTCGYRHVLAGVGYIADVMPIPSLVGWAPTRPGAFVDCARCRPRLAGDLRG